MMTAMPNDPDIEKMKAELDAIEDLLKNTPPPEPPRLEVEAVDVSSWTELGDFFNHPDSKSVHFSRDEILKDLDELEDLGDAAFGRVLYPCCFLNHSNVDRDQAVAALRAELKQVQDLGGEPVAFLARPSVIQLVRLAKDGETQDAEITVDLGGPRPGKKYYVALCFLFGYFRGNGYREYNDNLECYTHSLCFNVKNMQAFEVRGACQEGEVPAEES